MSTREKLARAIEQMPVINHHEHAWRSFSEDEGMEFDLPYFLCCGYLAGDLEAAGFRPEPDAFDYLEDPSLPDGSANVWAKLRPFLDRVANTSYFRYLLRALEDLFNVSERDVFSRGWKKSSDKIREYSREYKGAGPRLCARMNVAATVLDANAAAGELPRLACGNHAVLQVARMDMFIHEERGLAETLEQVSPKDLDEWLSAFDDRFRKELAAGACGFKSALAYNRRIEYSDPSADDVAAVFERGLLGASADEKRTYQDFMVNRLCRLCVASDVPLQIHTGIQAGTGHVLGDARPTLLTVLFRRHPQLRVDLFHGGYPWYVQGGLMAKYFPNVHIDGCWLSHISPSVYRRALTSWIETVPMSKIFAWGGDHTILEHSYASLAPARDLVADVLTELVDRGYFDTELALRVARRILHDNGAEFWRLESA